MIGIPFSAGAVAALALLAGGLVAWCARLLGIPLVMPAAALRAAAFVALLPVASMTTALGTLPDLAARNGAGTGEFWSAALVGFAGATITLAALAVGAWRAAARLPWMVGILTVVAAGVMMLGRMLAVIGAPSEFYVVDDAPYWLLSLVCATVAGIGMAMLSAAVRPQPRQVAA